jgi:hypothetical protein
MKSPTAITHEDMTHPRVQLISVSPSTTDVLSSRSSMFLWLPMKDTR